MRKGIVQTVNRRTQTLIFSRQSHAYRRETNWWKSVKIDDQWGWRSFAVAATEAEHIRSIDFTVKHSKIGGQGREETIVRVKRTAKDDETHLGIGQHVEQKDEAE
jgi:hypothetical protein